MYDEETYAACMAYIKKHSGGPGTDDYDDLDHRPKIEGVTLTGNKTASDLGLLKDVDVQGSVLII